MFSKWRSRKSDEQAANNASTGSSSDEEKATKRPIRSSLGILNDRETDEVPGSVILLSHGYKRNEPLGLQHARGRHSASSLPSPYPPPSRSSSRQSSRIRIPEKKKTKDGKFVLEPQPDDSQNDPLNWPTLRRDAALLSLGFYCMVGGGMTPVLAAGFKDVAKTYSVSIPQVALTTGLYMMGLGIGCVIMSPTAILWGKRPVYLSAIILFLLVSVWCALSPNYASLIVARIVMGIAVSPVECLPSASVAEIFFLHERAYRLGIYTLLLLGGKNLIPLVSAAIIGSLGWRWVFWIVAIVVGFCFCLLFFFVPETFWDRTPHRRKHTRSRSQSPASHHRPFPMPRFGSFRHTEGLHSPAIEHASPVKDEHPTTFSSPAESIAPKRPNRSMHVGFAVEPNNQTISDDPSTAERTVSRPQNPRLDSTLSATSHVTFHSDRREQEGLGPASSNQHSQSAAEDHAPNSNTISQSKDYSLPTDPEKPTIIIPPHSQPGFAKSSETVASEAQSFVYTDHYRAAPPKSYLASLRPWNGRLTKDKWFRVMLRPFILYAYPSVLWSSMVYSLSVGWLIVLSESVASIYENRDSYNFTALQTGLVYISPFVGGFLGTAVAGKVSDIIVRFMARRNDGVYEPEFRLVMAIPVAIATTIGLMGFGWSAEERDNWIVPTVFFGIISFGCSLGSTTSVTFVVDSYRQYAGEALVTLNFSKNIFHGLVFSLFFSHWLESDGSKTVFLALGGIQLACLLFTIPMYIYGKRARMWTVRKNMMEKL